MPSRRAWLRAVVLGCACAVGLEAVSFVRGSSIFAVEPVPREEEPVLPPRVELTSCPYPAACLTMGAEREREGHYAAAESLYDAACRQGSTAGCSRRTALSDWRRRRRRLVPSG